MIIQTGHCLNCDEHYAYAIKSIYDYPESVAHKCKEYESE